MHTTHVDRGSRRRARRRSGASIRADSGRRDSPRAAPGLRAGHRGAIRFDSCRVEASQRGAPQWGASWIVRVAESAIVRRGPSCCTTRAVPFGVESFTAGAHQAVSVGHKRHGSSLRRHLVRQRGDRTCAARSAGVRDPHPGICPPDSSMTRHCGSTNEQTVAASGGDPTRVVGLRPPRSPDIAGRIRPAARWSLADYDGGVDDVGRCPTRPSDPKARLCP